MTKEKARIYLAKQLPEMIKVNQYFHPNDSKNKIIEFLLILSDNGQGCITTRPILETEWLQICKWVEQNITDEHRIEYREKLSELLNDDYRIGLAIHATYTARATAMKKAEIKDL